MATNNGGRGFPPVRSHIPVGKLCTQEIRCPLEVGLSLCSQCGKIPNQKCSTVYGCHGSSYQKSRSFSA